MRFLIDAQLPRTLAEVFRASGHEAEHVLDLALALSSDREIAAYAQANETVVVTKDEDFVDWTSRGRIRVFWIRLGNCTNEVLFQSTQGALPSALERFRQGDRLVEFR